VLQTSVASFGKLDRNEEPVGAGINLGRSGLRNNGFDWKSIFGKQRDACRGESTIAPWLDQF
jgi:hypothetical protein